MRDRKILLSLVCASVIPCAIYVLLVRMGRCYESIESDVGSPDGRQVATSSMRACPVGLLSSTNYSVFVNLRHGGTSSSRSTLIFQLNDAAEPPTLTWNSSNELIVKLKDTGQVELAKLEAQGTRIHYTVPNWIYDSLTSIEANRLGSERESEALYKSGKLSEADFRAMGRIDEAVAQEQASFRRWVSTNASVENGSSK